MKVLIKKDPRYPLEVKEIRQIALQILENYDLPQKTELSINFVGKRKAKNLNNDYRNKDYIPKVLSFPQHNENYDSERDLSKSKDPDGILRLGDVVVCFPLARKEARRRQRMVNEIIRELLDHGINNLLGKL